jgi:hypothetical protein
MSSVSSYFSCAERASGAYVDDAVLALYSDATLPALEGDVALPSDDDDLLPPDILQRASNV